MPQIGRPADQNPFAKVKMAPKQVDANRNPGQNKQIGDELNRMVGNDTAVSGVKYVDRNKHNQMGQNEFLKLLTNQLTHQDPMNPMEQEKFSSELAQYSSLQELTSLNSKFDKLGANKNVEDKFYGASFLGKEVVTSGSTIKYNGKDINVDLPFSIPQKASKVILRLMDKQGQMIQQIEKENVNKGMNTITWDGVRSDGVRAETGEFRINVFAYDDANTPIKVDTKTTGIVNSVTFENGETVLKLKDGSRVFLRDVDVFNLPKEVKAESNVGVPDMVKNQKAVNAYDQVGELQ